MRQLKFSSLKFEGKFYARPSNQIKRLPSPTFLNHKKILATINNRSHCQGTESRSILTPSILAIIEEIEIENDAIMASAATQAQANALNAKMEGEASKMLDDVERNWMRKVARQSFACAVKCYDKAGTTGAAESLEACTRNCQGPYQQSSSMVQQEVAQFQNRLNRNMQECQEKARDLVKPGYENDPNQIAKVEQALISCMSNQVNEHIKLLKPMKDRIISVLKNYS